MRTVRVRERIKRYLMERGETSTITLGEHLNDTMKWGVTMQQLGNVLSKDKDILCVGHTNSANTACGGRYKVMVWELTPEYMERNKGSEPSREELAEKILQWLESQGPGQYMAKDIRKGLGGHSIIGSNVYKTVADNSPEWLTANRRTGRGIVYEVLPRT